MKYAIVGLVLLLMVVGCAETTPTATPQPAATQPPAAASLTDSATATPTATPQPTATQPPAPHGDGSANRYPATDGHTTARTHGDALHRLSNGQHRGEPDLYDAACPRGVSHGDLPGHHGRAGTGTRGGQ